MRNAFAKAMVRLADQHPELVLLTGDMGNRLFNEFKEKFPDRFYNCGVAEANMTSLAAGLAMCGFIPVTYSIASFNTFRCMEQIKVDVCYHKLPVIVTGVGSGLSYAELGATHQSCEDIAMIRSIPGITVIAPGDAVEVELALKASVELGKPVYLRLGKKNEPVIHSTAPNFEIGKAIPVIEEGKKDVCLISTGNLLPVAVETAQIIIEKKMGVSLYSMHTVKPLDVSLLETVFNSYKCVATIEEHSVIGGLGSAVGEWLVDDEQLMHTKSAFKRIGCRDLLSSSPGSQGLARSNSGIIPGKIAKNLLDIVDKVNDRIN